MDPLGRAGLLAMAVFLGVIGCEPPSTDRLVVATSWPPVDRRRIESEFAAWLANASSQPARGPVRLDWRILAPGDDLAGLAGRRRPPDVLLGGPVGSFDRLAQRGQLAPLPLEGSPPWLVARVGRVELVVATVGTSRSDSPPGARSAAGSDGSTTPDEEDLPVAFDDPRDDPISLAWAKGLLDPERFHQGYFRLVRLAGDSPRIGRRPGQAQAAVARGEARRAPAVVLDSLDPRPGAFPGPRTYTDSWIEAVAIPRDGRHPDLARAFVEFLSATGRARPAPDRLPAPSAADDLLADLLGATLVDAQDELWSAWSALNRAGSPQQALHWMAEPPPWPPASVARLLGRADHRAMALLDTLVGQLATDPAVRAWLVRSWLSPPRTIDVTLLVELAAAEDGRLAREPRFRDWLRAEWTAWARQRYRRVARLAIRSD